MIPCPRGLCDGSGTLAPHPATMGADAGVDDPCPCRDASTVSPLDAAWAARDAAESTYDLRKEEASRAQKAETAQWAEVVRLDRAARALGPRPATVPT